MGNYYEGIPFGSKIGRGRRRNRSLFPFLAAAVILVGVAYLLMNSEITTVWNDAISEAQVMPTATTKPAVLVAIPTLRPTPIPPTATPQPTATATPEPTPAAMLVANTGGLGVYLRSTPSSEQRIKAWVDGTKLSVIGPSQDVGGTKWLNVKDPAGNEGWVPQQYLAPAPAGATSTPGSPR